MKALIQNYVNGESTEAGYLSEALTRMGLEAQLWSDGRSAFDKLDMYKPDVIFCHYMFLTGDIIKYLSNKKTIQIVVNVSGIQQHELETIESEILEKGINCPFLFSNLPKDAIKVKTKKLKLHSVMNGADIFLPTAGSFIDYDIDLGIVCDYNASSRFSEEIEGVNSWHFITTSPELESADLAIPIQYTPELYGKYKKVIVTVDGPRVPQQFFDAILHGKDVSFKGKYETQDETSQRVITKLLGSDSKSWKSAVKNKHTCLNRVQKLIKLLGNEDMAKSMNSIIKEYANDNSNSEWL